MNIIPIGKRVLVEVTKVEEKTTSGILLVSSSNDKNYKIGIIKSLSKDSEILETFSLGQKIIFSKNSGISIENSNRNEFILNLEEILGIISE